VPHLTITRIRPVRPYDMRLSAAGTAGGTRRWHGAMLLLALPTDGGESRAAVRQRHDGDLEVAVRAPDLTTALDQVRFMLATGDDHAPFLRMARRDPRMAPVVVRRAGYRPARTGTVAHALVSAVCGQLVTAREAARMERAVVGMAGHSGADGLVAPPTSAAVAALAPARAASAGLAARRATAMTRLARAVDLERLHGVSTDAMTARVTREPWLGPWSAGIIGMHGLGRFDAPVVGDLGLMRILAAETGRWPEADDTRALVAGYGEWAGLASAYLLMHPLARSKQGAPRARAA
jgi:AraC family transcriptional regulator, regulatory protein of adaptative response / DNA-3-methyladenine glycosylase II